MPVYEYYCQTCNSKFEKLQPMSASAESASCPSGHAAARALSLVARVGQGMGGEDFDWGGMSDSAGCACGGACSCAS